MNNKGFTLIELLVTISVLALISLVIGVNITSILRSTEKSNEDFEKEQIEKAACVYVDSQLCNNCNDNVSLSDLINNGLLDDSYNSKEGTIKVTRTDGEKVCKFIETKS
ncbi:MAG: type II secretion system protein [Firmicutes bacterium]|nr:type II secretion system protein [Bacillota bacterium]